MIHVENAIRLEKAEKKKDEEQQCSSPCLLNQIVVDSCDSRAVIHHYMMLSTEGVWMSMWLLAEGLCVFAFSFAGNRIDNAELYVKMFNCA
ncbi:hypothetical protein KIN20_011344 [Parelaphostrongylus tenuis]|uniref:Uncharacterized protein n=1 Tax=Parelaphostrongylus tenuis TaxID=148309 RepID=A0AAD5QLZ7_PARTN|nr:hypothetical protein KIN20_011344 [Parelaphostrongylus tenuis]